MSKWSEYASSQGWSTRSSARARSLVGLAVSAAVLQPACSQSAANALSCGPGTEQRGAECVPVVWDASTDNPQAADAESTLEGSADGVTQEPVCAKTGKCPTGAMVTINRPAASGGPFKIDAHETTVGEYQRFLSDVEAGLVPVQTDESCAWNLTYQFDEPCLASIGGKDVCGNLTSPAACVDQCDARAYCELWAGKRLCTDTEPSTDLPSPWASEVYAACSGGGSDPNPNSSQDALWDCVACRPPCEDATPGVYGLSTSFSEWTSYCRIFDDPVSNKPSWGCSTIFGTSAPTCNNRVLRSANMVGGITIRCCA
jgi:hypothetical protein